MTDVDGKYVVFKREDFEKAMTVISNPDDFLEKAEPLLDAVVLREQDIHCAGALYAYAASVMATHEIMEQMGADPDSREMRDLDKIVDWASGTADRARQFGKRVPTL
jgi:hypothetical protein